MMNVGAGTQIAFVTETLHYPKFSGEYGWGLSSNQDIYTPLNTIEEGSRKNVREVRKKAEMPSSGPDSPGVLNSEQLCLSALGLHTAGPVNSQRWKGLRALPLPAGLLGTDTQWGEGLLVSCVHTGKPARHQRIAPNPWSHNSVGHKKDMNVGTGL